MVKLKNSVRFTLMFCVFTLGLSALQVKHDDDIKEYIVYLGRTSTSNVNSVSSQHISILKNVVQGRSAEETITQRYKRSFSGFAARLTHEEYLNLKSMKEVVSIFPSRKLKLHTTRSWDFLGVPPPSVEQQTSESNIIIGVMDTGIWPESLSFSDTGLSPNLPIKWKGECNGGKNFTCNNKIIGARTYVGNGARDDDGHGSHTASTAAGRIVSDTNFYGYAKGSARGGVPSARIAVYKVCDITGCGDSQILAGFDDAIADGVDVITISIGGSVPIQFHNDTVAIGAFHAMEKGVLTVQSVGNDGDAWGTTVSVAPWIFSVAASTTDRFILDHVVLGNKTTLTGNTINTYTLQGKDISLVYGKDAVASPNCTELGAQVCDFGCLDEHKVKGKIVVCDEDDYGEGFRVGALGVLALGDYPDISILPAAKLNTSDFQVLKAYLNSTNVPTANILRSETITDAIAPTVAKFSSRGPNLIAPDILKPDISAPGVEILAAYSPDGIVSAYEEDDRSVTYNLVSGTSMACPHVAAAAVFVKSVHPDWSPAAIKSSLMTTANPTSSSDHSNTEFGSGSGNLNPIKATNPGLVYEATQNDYTTFLCRLGYDSKKLAIMTGSTTNVTCTEGKSGETPNDVNYPSMSVKVDAQKKFEVKFFRSVMNFGVANSSYTANLTIVGSNIQVKVEPSTLLFTSLKETKSFNVSVVGNNGLPPKSLASASLVWTDGVHSVRSPIVVYTSS